MLAVERWAERMAAHAPATANAAPRERALATIALCVGGLTIARSLRGQPLSDEFLRACENWALPERHQTRARSSSYRRPPPPRHRRPSRRRHHRRSSLTRTWRRLGRCTSAPCRKSQPIRFAGDQAVLHHEAARRTRGGSRGGILDAGGPSSRRTQSRRPPPLGADDVEAATLEAGGVEDGVEPARSSAAASTALRVGSGATMKVEPQFTSCAGARRAERPVEAKCGGQPRGVGDRLAEGRLLLRHPREGQRAVLHSRSMLVGPTPRPKTVRDSPPSRRRCVRGRRRCRWSDGRRTASRRAREDANARSVPGRLGREHEGALGVVRLPRQA